MLCTVWGMRRLWVRSSPGAICFAVRFSGCGCRNHDILKLNQLKDRRWLIQENVIGDPYSILCIRQHYAIFEVSYSSYHEIEQMFAVRNVLFLNLRCISSNCFWYFVTTEKYYSGYIKGITVSYLKSCRRRLGIWPSQMRINLATRSGASKTNTYDRQIPNWHMQLFK